MQDKIADSSHFFRRTDALANQLRLNRDDLPEVIGISKRMFYGYRNGTYPISPKAWRKLEAAEREAGLRPQPSEALKEASEAGLHIMKDAGPGQAAFNQWREMLRLASAQAATAHPDDPARAADFFNQLIEIVSEPHRVQLENQKRLARLESKVDALLKRFEKKP